MPVGRVDKEVVEEFCRDATWRRRNLREQPVICCANPYHAKLEAVISP